jgi:3-methyladenine DNA glycosylase AlkC
MGTTYSITDKFGNNLALLLSEKIRTAYKDFDQTGFISRINQTVEGKTYTQRVEIFADHLHACLPFEYPENIALLCSVLGNENPNETGMFTNYYWVLPIGKFIEKYGLDHFDVSMKAISEVTRRNTGEYAIRPFIRKYPERCLKQMMQWAESDNFHLRRLASEGLRPKLPWASKLEVFINNPYPVFNLLEVLKEDNVMFVKKSVANHLTDWLKVNPEPTIERIKSWQRSDNIHTRWIIKRATRKLI